MMPNYDELPPGEQPGDDAPLRVDEATQAIIAPLAIDVSVSMRDALPFLQESLATFTGELRANPLTAQYVHLGVVTFSGAAATDLPVTRAADPRTVLPSLAVRSGGTNFAAGFAAVHACLRDGIAKVAAGGQTKIQRPTIFWVSDGQHNAWQDWRPELAAIRAERWRPNVFAFGFGGADEHTMREIADPGLAYFAREGRTPEAVMEEILEVVLRSLVSISGAVAGGAGAVPPPPTGAGLVNLATVPIN